MTTDPDACAQPTATLALAVAAGCALALVPFGRLAIHAVKYIHAHKMG